MKDLSERLAHYSDERKVVLVNVLFDMVGSLVGEKSAAEIESWTGLDIVKAEYILDSYTRLRDDKSFL